MDKVDSAAVKLMCAMVSLDSFDAAAKARYHKAGRSFLRALAVESLHLEPDAFDVRSCMGGPAVSGEIILHTDTLYVQVNADSGVAPIMFRKCNGRKDYSGGRNQWADVRSFAHKADVSFLDLKD